MPAMATDDLHLMMSNEYGSLRWANIRSFYYSDQINEDAVKDLYLDWRNDDEFYLFKCIEKAHIPFLYGSGSVPFNSVFYKFVKAAKRGNDVYQHVVGERFAVLDNIKHITFFEEEWKHKATNLLFITLTFGQRVCNDCHKHYSKKATTCRYCGSKHHHDVSIKEAWEGIGPDWNRFISALKRQYGDIEFMRTWESHKSYYPHIHAMIAFCDHEFPVFTHFNKKGSRTFRVSDFDNNKIKGLWHSPSVDVQAVSNTQDAFNDLTKYITDDLCSKKGFKTNAMICLFGKQSYAISKKFVTFVDDKFNGDKELREDVNALLLRNMCNSNKGNVDYEFIGILPARMLGMSGQVWAVTMKKPPPELQKVLDYEHERYLLLNGGL